MIWCYAIVTSHLCRVKSIPILLLYDSKVRFRPRSEYPIPHGSPEGIMDRVDEYERLCCFQNGRLGKATRRLQRLAYRLTASCRENTAADSLLKNEWCQQRTGQRIDFQWHAL